MYLDGIPLNFRQHETFYLIAPDMSRTEEMQQKLNAFSSLHHEFLLWSPGFHSLNAVEKNMAEAAGNFLNDNVEYRF